MTLEEIIELREMEKEIRKEIRKERRIEDKEIQKYDDEIKSLYSKYQIEMVTVRDQLESTCFLDDVFLANNSTLFTAKYNALDVEHKRKYNNNLLDKVIIVKTVPGTVVIKTTLRYPNNPLLKFTQIFSTGVLQTNLFKDRTNYDLVFTALRFIVIPSDRVSILEMSKKKILNSSTRFKFLPYQYDICFVSNLNKDDNKQIAYTTLFRSDNQL